MTNDDIPDEIEITPEMMEAGMAAYVGYWIGCRDADDDREREMVQEVFRAMLRARPGFFRATREI